MEDTQEEFELHKEDDDPEFSDQQSLVRSEAQNEVEDLEGKQDRDLEEDVPFPFMAVGILSSIILCDAFSMTYIFPIQVFMVDSFGIADGEEQIGL